MPNSMTTQPDAQNVIVGVDTHKHVHVAVAIGTKGIRLDDQSFVADSGGYRALLTWADTLVEYPLNRTFEQHQVRQFHQRVTVGVA